MEGRNGTKEKQDVGACGGEGEAVAARTLAWLAHAVQSKKKAKAATTTSTHAQRARVFVVRIKSAGLGRDSPEEARTTTPLPHFA